MSENRPPSEVAYPIFDPEVMPQPIREWEAVLPGGERVLVSDYGPMRELYGAGRDPEVRGRVWSGALSFADRCAAKPTLHDRMIEATERITDYYQLADLTAASRCVDCRRSVASLAPGFFEQPRPLGPQTTGATAVLAKVDRIVQMGDDPVIRTTHGQDLRRIGTKFKRAGLRSGAHIDIDHLALGAGVRDIVVKAAGEYALKGLLKQAAGEHVQRTLATAHDIGCTAVDKMLPIARKKIDTEAAIEMYGLARLLLGGTFDWRVVDELVGRELRLLAHDAQYFEQDPGTGILLYRQQALEQILAFAEEREAAYEILQGPMNPVALIYNTVYPYTFNRDRFSHDNSDEIQAFNHDIWRSTGVVAPVLYPFKPGMTPAQRERVQRKHIEFETLRAMYTIGTMMTATDGTGHLIVIRSLSQ
jgi:hypothetical protein